MPRYNQTSKDRLITTHPDLILLFNTVIETFDCSILEGLRGEEAQTKYFTDGKSKVEYPNSRHNRSLILGNDNVSDAIDAAPYPIDWDDTERFYYFGGVVMGIASQLFREGLMKHRVRFGGDWDGDTEVSDQTFMDLVHFELIK